MSLAGKTILLTREKARSSSFAVAAGRMGARVLHFPVTVIEAPESWEACDRALGRLVGYAGIAFTSANGVRAFLGRCRELGVGEDKFHALRLYAVGPQTAEAIRREGLSVTAVPEECTAADLGAMLDTPEVKDRRFLLPQGNLAREVLAGVLRQAGAAVDTVEVYRTVSADPGNAGEIWRHLEAGEIDLVVFASPSAVSSFARLYPAERLGPLDCRTAIAVIGPTTGDAVRGQKWAAAVAAQEFTMQGVLDAIMKFFDR